MQAPRGWLAVLFLALPVRLLAACEPALDASAGASLTLVLRADGSVWSFGSPNAPQGPYADGGAEAVLIPLPVRATAVAAGGPGAALGEDGSIWTWIRAAPSRVAGVPPAAFIGASSDSIYAVDLAGQAWRIPFHGLLPPEVIGSFVTPRPLVALAVHARGLTGLDGAGGVWRLRTEPACPLPSAPVPRGPAEALGGLPPVIAIAAAHEGALALDINGDTWLWGCFAAGLALDPTITSSDVPVRSASAPGATKVAMRRDNCFAVNPAAGTAVAWGNGWLVGDGTGRDAPATAPRSVAVPDVRHIGSGEGHVLAIDGSGQAWAWGYNTNGERFTREPTLVREPAEVAGLSGVIDVDAGETHVLAVTADGRAWSWGTSWEGVLGSGPGQQTANTPVQVVGTGYSACEAGGTLSAFLKLDGTAWSSGYGIGATPDSIAWEPVNAGLSNVIGIAAGTHHVIALRDDGSVWGWGSNRSNQLGLGAGVTFQATPAQVPGLDRIVSISAVEESSSALRDDGSVWFWGDNEGSRSAGLADDIAPTQAVTGPFATHAQGGWHSLALDASGGITAWGWYPDGAIGIVDPPLDDCDLYAAPSIIPDLTAPERVDPGFNNSYAIMPDGTTWAWGWNEYGFAAPDLQDQTVWTPRVLAGVPPLAEVSSGWTVTAARTRDGRVLTWGEDRSGQLGQGRHIVVVLPFLLDLGDALDGLGASLRLSRVPGGSLLTWGSRFGTSTHRVYRATRPDMSDEIVVVETPDASWIDADVPAPAFYYRVAGLDCAGVEGP